MSLLIERPEELETTKFENIITDGKQYLILGTVRTEKKNELVLDALKEVYKERGEVHHKKLLDCTNRKYAGKYYFNRSVLHEILVNLKNENKIEEVSKRIGSSLNTFYRPKE